MADAGQDKTALGIARARFMDGLPRKAKELKGAVTLLLGTPDADRPREEMRRRLHALYASAQVFQEETLANALRDGIQRLDSAREAQRPLSEDDLDMLVELAAQLPNLGSGRTGTPSVSMRPRPPAAGRTGATSARAPGAHAPQPPPVPPPAPRIPEPPPSAMEPQRVSKVPRATSARPAPAVHSDVISVMVVDDTEAEAQVRRALPLEQFEVIATRDPEEALRMARAAAPDVVLVGRDVVSAGGSDLIGRLRADPLTDFVPVILLWPADATHDPSLQDSIGADDSLRKPIDATSLLRRIAALTAAPGRFGGGIDTLQEATVEEVAERVAREIRQGIVDSVQTGRHQAIALGDGTDILAAAWSAIGRIRAHLAQRSGGRVRFRDVPRRGGPAMLALVNESAEADEASVEQLKGRRILVADDDPAVLWFFSGLLKEAGATVIEAADGRAALAQTRRQRPDVVISDILMPEVDGFALCRELKRDVSVADIPVILLSWKEDFLQRMRELQSGASGYLLKEAGGRQILARVLEVLRPRLRLEDQLRAGGEMRGRIDGVGVVSLLETVATQRPDARVTIRDAWNLFELDLRKGNLVTASRTSTDGSFARGDLALKQMLGAKSGRFTVTDSDAPVRPIFDQPIGRLLTDAARKLSALLDAVSDTRLMQIHQVTFDDPTLAAMVSTSPTPTRDILERLRSGASPRQMVIDGEFAPHELESVLDDAARRGALTRVLGAKDEDLVALALAERERDPAVLMHSNRPPARRSDAPEDDTPELPSSELKSEPPGPGLPGLGIELEKALAAAKEAAADGDAQEREAERELEAALERGSIRPPIVVMSAPPPVPEAAVRRSLPQELAPPRVPSVPEADLADASVVAAHEAAPEDVLVPVPAADDPTPVDAEAPQMPEPPVEITTPTELVVAAEPSAAEAERPADGVTVASEAVVPPEPTIATADTLIAMPSVPPPAVSEPVAQASAAAAVEVAPPEAVAQREPPKPAPIKSDAPAKPAASAQPGAWSRVLFVTALAAVGYGGYQVLQQQNRRNAPPAAAETASANDPADENADDEMPAAGTGGTGTAEPEATAGTSAPAVAPTAAAAPTATDTATPTPEPSPERDVGFGHVLPYIDESRGTKVAPGEGLLVVEANTEVPNARVRLGERDLGTAPISTSLPPGRHEVIFQRGDESSFRYLVIRGGETRIVQVP